MIRIIAGTFGWIGTGRMEAINAKSGPRTLPPDVEARLVAEGIAEYVHDDVSKEKTMSKPNAQEELLPGVPTFETMTKAQLASAMDDAGLRRTGTMAKKEMVEKLNAFYHA